MCVTLKVSTRRVICSDDVSGAKVFFLAISEFAFAWESVTNRPQAVKNCMETGKKYFPQILVKYRYTIHRYYCIPVMSGTCLAGKVSLQKPEGPKFLTLCQGLVATVLINIPAI